MTDHLSELDKCIEKAKIINENLRICQFNLDMALSAVGAKDVSHSAFHSHLRLDIGGEHTGRVLPSDNNKEI